MAQQPKLAGPEAAPTDLLSVMQQGVEEVARIQQFFSDVAEVHESRYAVEAEEALEQEISALTSGEDDLAETYKELGLDPLQNVDDSLRAMLLHKGEPSIMIAAYATYLGTREDAYIEKVAKNWAEREDVKAFVGQAVIIKPAPADSVERRERDGWDSLARPALADAMGWLEEYATGTVSDLSISLQHPNSVFRGAGSISLRDGEIGKLAKDPQRAITKPFQQVGVQVLFDVNSEVRPPVARPLIQVEAA